jgi:hypothetical protein
LLEDTFIDDSEKFYDSENLENNDMENHFGSQLFDKSMVTKDENVNWFRNDVPGTTVDHVIVK